jgi:tetratricopeptide (TPR) repeat protein
VWRDPWALAVALAVVPVLVAARSGLPGEPVADDFGFLHRALLSGHLDWLGGGGSPLYWRPLSRQLYYRLLGPLMLSHPLLVALLQAALLAAAGVLLYRALRPAWPAPAAAAAGAFPLLLEANRQLIAWPSCAQDVLAMLFGVAALHALSRARRPLALGCLALALLSKETAIAFAPALALWPAHRRADGTPARGPDRLRTAAGAAAVLAAWWLVHEWVSRRAGLLPPPQAAAAHGASVLLAQARWAVRGVWLDALSVRDPGAATAAWLPWAVLLVLAPTLTLVATHASGRQRLRAALPWLGWAAVWAGIATVPLATFMPAWSSHRSVIPALGLGVALVALLRAAPPAWLGVLTGLRLVSLLTSPVAPERIGIAGSNVEFDFARLTTLQRLAHEVRATLMASHPTLPRGAHVARNQWPRGTLFAFQDPRAFQVWYRDTTLRVIEMAEVQANPLHPLAAIVEFEPHRTPQVAMISPLALQHVLLAADSLRHNRDTDALALLADFEALQADTACAVFMATGLTIRAGALLELRRDAEAVATLRRALEYYPLEANAHRLLSEYHRINGRPGAAIRELREQLRIYPNDADARTALEQLLRQEQARPPAPER